VVRIGQPVFRPDDEGGGEGGGTPAAWTPPDGLEQFKSPDDLAKSYLELRPEMDRLRSQLEAERAQFAETISALGEQQPAHESQGNGQFDPSVSAWTKAMEDGDYATAMRIQAEMAQKPLLDAVGKVLDDRFEKLQPTLEAQSAQQRQTAITMAEDMVAKEIGTDQYAALLPQIQELVAANPHYLPSGSSVEGYRDAILNVAKLASYDAQQKQLAALQAERAEKAQAQTLTGSGRVAQVVQGDAAQQEVERIKATRVGSYGELMGGR